MTFFEALYKLFIGPLELFFEIIFVIANRLIGNLGLSIIILSLVMNFLVLPLYKRADAMQDEQRETEKKLKKWVTHIKKSFKGDERFMMLQTYYRQNNYKPTSILKGSVSLLLEIPFFIAAYNFLSHAGVFNGFAFGPFADMGQPDGLLKIGSLSINVLPVLMTGINIVSSAIYTKGLPVSSKVQLYGMAGIFLVLLYNSPAALVFYWTLNNLFSLVKNLFYKLKNPGIVLAVMASVAGVAAFVFDIVHPFNTFKKNLFVIGFGILLQLPLVWHFVKKHVKKPEPVILAGGDKAVFYLGSVFLAVLTGVLIPSAVIGSSPEEFINTLSLANPLNYVLSSGLLAAGLFIVWFGIFYGLANNSGKKVLEIVVSILSIGGVINYMFFGRKQGTLSPFLKLENGFLLDKKEALVNILVLAICVAVICLLFIKNRNIIKYALSVSVAGIVFMSCLNCVRLNIAGREKIENLKESGKGSVSIPLSKNGNNVMIFMMDRAINSYIPYLFNEKPELAEQFAGFTYYPNTMSFGGHTNFGLPSVFGGYEYTPEELNKRDSESLESKHNEAMKVLPVLFSENGYETTVCDPSYAGYDWIPDLSIYDDYPGISKYITMDGSIGNNKEEVEANKTKILNRNFFLYSFSKIIPLCLQATVYNGGSYNNIHTVGQVVKGLYTSTGVFQTFVDAYNVLKHLPDLTDVKDSSNNTFMMMCNDTTHSPCLLQVPEYVPAEVVDNREYENTHSDRFTVDGKSMKMDSLLAVEHYQINMAAMIQLGSFFDYLREMDVYDNTKIIIVADHGYANKQFDNLVFGDERYEDAMLYNPLLMIKDFNSNAFVTDDSFMTNADVPSYAVKDLIDEPVNPFTGKLITNDEKYAHDQHIITSHEWHTTINNGNTYLPAPWYAVHDNVLDLNNWTLISD